MTSPDSATSACPNRQVLSDLTVGKLPVSEIDRLAAHLDSCTTCQSVLETLDGIDDSIVAELQEPPDELHPADPALESRIRKAEAIRTHSFSVESEVSLPPPESLGPYQLIHPLGAGGMGTVWKAVHTHLKRPVALKVLRTARHQSDDARARFYREMEAIGRLDHSNLVRAYDAGIADDRDFLAMELLDGVDGRRLIQEHGPLPVAEGCEIVRQVAVGLQYAHERGLIHRDVKPSNLMVTQSGQVKVLDLGLARFHDAAPDAGDRTDEGKIVGSADYIAPEQIEDTREADARADIYSLGCTLYCLLTGRPPFSGSSCDTLGKKLIAHSRQPFPRIRSTRSDIPRGLESVLDRMVVKAPSDRFQTAGYVADALAPFCLQADLKRLVEGGSPPAPSPVGPSRKRTAWLSLFVIVAVATLFGGIWFGEVILLLIRDEGLLIAKGQQSTIVLIDDSGKERLTIQPEQAGGVRVQSGNYDVRLSGDASALSVTPTSITIHRGKTTEIMVAPGPPTEVNPPSITPSREKTTQEQELTSELINSIDMPFRLIPAGEFVMGSPDNELGREWHEGPQHRVAISRPFYIGTFEVTQDEFERVMGRNPSRFAPTGLGAVFVPNVNTKTLPVESIRWTDAVEFCEKLSSLPDEQDAGRVYRLPTEAEWEYACRAGTQTVFHYGDTISADDLNYKTTFPYGDAEPKPPIGRPTPVGSFAPNAWGLYDMHGNIWEWTSDWYSADYYHHAPVADPPGPEDGSFKVLRGGGWGVKAEWCRSSFRASGELAPKIFYSVGFRVVCEVDKE